MLPECGTEMEGAPALTAEYSSEDVTLDRAGLLELVDSMSGTPV